MFLSWEDQLWVTLGHGRVELNYEFEGGTGGEGLLPASLMEEEEEEDRSPKQL